MRYKVHLTQEERARLLELTRKGTHSAREFTRARGLLLLDEGVPAYRVAPLIGVDERTVKRLRRRYAEEGLEAALRDRPRQGVPPKLTGKEEAFLIALACTDAPEGRTRWTMQMLADRFIQLQPDDSPIQSVSDETVRRVLKKTGFALGSKSSGVCPP